MNNYGNKDKNKTFYVYRVDHVETGEFYFGSRGCKCSPEKDIKYLGSMTTWKPDKTKLIKTIIQTGFTTREEAIELEIKLITENIEHLLNRNYHTPKGGYHLDGMTTVKDKGGVTMCVQVDDPRIQKGELIPINKGKQVVKDKDGNVFQVNRNDPRYLNGELLHITKGLVVVKNKKGQVFSFPKNSPEALNQEFQPFFKGKVSVKDVEGNFFSVSVNDPRYLSGELMGVRKGIVAHNKGKPMSNEQKEKLRKPKTEEHKKHLSEAKKGKGTKSIICLNNKTVYKSIKEAGECLTLFPAAIVTVLKGRSKHVKGYSFCYV